MQIYNPTLSNAPLFRSGFLLLNAKKTREKTFQAKTRTNRSILPCMWFGLDAKQTQYNSNSISFRHNSHYRAGCQQNVGTL